MTTLNIPLDPAIRPAAVRIADAHRNAAIDAHDARNAANATAAIAGACSDIAVSAVSHARAAAMYVRGIANINCATPQSADQAERYLRDCQTEKSHAQEYYRMAIAAASAADPACGNAHHDSACAVNPPEFYR